MKYLIGLDGTTGQWEVYSAYLGSLGGYSGISLVRVFGLFDQAMMFICAREWEEKIRKAKSDDAPEANSPEASEQKSSTDRLPHDAAAVKEEVKAWKATE